MRRRKRRGGVTDYLPAWRHAKVQAGAECCRATAADGKNGYFGAESWRVASGGTARYPA